MGRPLLAVEQAVLLEEDPAEARRIGREYIAFYLTLPNYVRAWERAGFGPEDRADGGSDRLVDAMVAWGARMRSPSGCAPTWTPAPTTSASTPSTPTRTPCPSVPGGPSPQRCTPGEHASGPGYGVEAWVAAKNVWGDACVSTDLSTQSRSLTA